MAHDVSSSEHPHGEPRRGLLAWWHHTPLYLRIIGALILGTITGVALGEQAGNLEEVSRLVLRLLQALATPLILVAVIHALANAKLEGKIGLRLAGLLIVNTLVAIAIGLLVANVVQPGRWGARLAGSGEMNKRLDPWKVLTDMFPHSLMQPLIAGEWPLAGDQMLVIRNNVMQVIVIALAFGIAFRVVRQQQIRAGETAYHSVEAFLNTAFNCLMVVLHWIIDLIPFAVFAIVASRVGREGFEPFKSLAGLVVAVLLALALQAGYYLLRVRLGSWVKPRDFLAGGSNALLSAFSTASSTATMPITYGSLKDRIGVREQSASLGSLVGSNFNNDGTALYEAMAALFVAQMIGVNLTPMQQVLVVFTSVIASVGAAGIPEAGLVTMTLVFSAVHLPTEYILTLVTVDWFLDRCRTAINVMGDMTVSCLLDGKEREAPHEGDGPGGAALTAAPAV